MGAHAQKEKKKFHTRQFKSRVPRETQCCVPLSEIGAHHTHTTPITQASLHPPIPPFWSLLPPALSPSNTAVNVCEPKSLSFHYYHSHTLSLAYTINTNILNKTM